MIYGALYGSYDHLQSVQLTSCQASLAADEKSLAADQGQMSFQGVVDPALLNATIALTVRQTNPDSSGRFLLQKKGVDLVNDSVALYVITESKYFKKQIFPGDNISNLQIDLGGK